MRDTPTAPLRLVAPGGGRGWVDPRALPAIGRYLPDPGAVDPGGGTRIKRKGSRSLTLAPEGFLLKHFYSRNPWRSILHSLIPSPAGNAWRNHRALVRAGFPAPRALASIVVRRPFPVYRESWFFLERFPDTTTLRDLLLTEHELFAGRDPRRLEPLVAAADLIARLHRLGWFHQDLNAKNLLLDRDGRAWMIDFDGSLRLGWLWSPVWLLLRLVDLRRFHSSLRFWIRRTDRERFLRRYFAHFAGGRLERRLFGLFLRFTSLFNGHDAKMQGRDRKAALVLEAARRNAVPAVVEERSPSR